MTAIESVIKTLEPTYNTKRIAIRRRVKANPWFRKGKGYVAPSTSCATLSGL
jgi:hypothetical protein